MSVQYLGSVSTAEIAPGLGLPLITLIGELQAQLAALAELSLTVDLGSISLAAQIEVLLDLVAKLQAAIALGLDFQLPSIDFSANLQIDLQLKLKLLLDLQFALSAAGIHAFRYDGRADSMAAEVGAAVDGLPGVQPSDAAHGIVLLATVPEAVEALRKIFAG